MPLPLMAFVYLASLFIKNKLIAKKLRTGVFIGLIFFSNPYIANLAMKSWESKPTSIDSITLHEIAVVLTGVTNRDKFPKDRVYFNKGADRVMHTVQLYQLGKISHIIISGGSGKLINNDQDIKEADELALVFKMSGVPDSVITIENKSRNTYESAKHIASLPMVKNSKILLVTSAFHIKRARACFVKQQINITSFATDFYSIDSSNSLDRIIVPNPFALTQWHKIIHEMLGIIMYKIMGYC